MRIWNLSRPSDLVDNVAEKFAYPDAIGRAPSNPAQRPSFVKALAGIATLAVSISVNAGTVNSEKSVIPNRVFVIAQSIQEQPPPLDEIFKNRFDDNWTRDEEEALLSQIAETVLDSSPGTDSADAVVRFVFANQQESMTMDVPRLSLRQVGEAFRQGRKR